MEILLRLVVLERLTLYSATDTVSISYTEALTTLTYNSGTNTLTYVDESGTTHNLALITGTGGGGGCILMSFVSSCSISNLSDVTTFGAPTNGDALTWSNVYSAFIPQQPYQYFSISDGVNTQTIQSTNTITFTGVGGLSVGVQALRFWFILSYATSNSFKL